MRSRRRDKRFRLTEPANGTVRIFPEVIVQQNGDDEWIALSREAAVVGEALVLDIAIQDPDFGDLRHQFPVWVIDSRPVIVEGDMRHRIRLQAGELAAIAYEHQVRRG